MMSADLEEIRSHLPNQAIGVSLPDPAAYLSVTAHDMRGAQDENTGIIYMSKRFWKKKESSLAPDLSFSDLRRESKISDYTLDVLGRLLMNK